MKLQFSDKDKGTFDTKNQNKCIILIIKVHFHDAVVKLCFGFSTF